MTSTSPLDGCHVLLVEDEPLIGLDISLSLKDAGARVHGPHRNVKDALTAIDNIAADSGFDGAILDFQLGDETCEPIAITLKKHGVPFILHTGNLPAAKGLVNRLGIPVVEKPALPTVLISALQRHLKP